MKMLKRTERTIETDKYWDRDVSNKKLSDRVFERVSAKDIRFASVDFKYCVFDDCYLRSCAFDSCDFTGCRFVRTSFHGSTFTGCIFDYASFDRTLIDPDILDTCCPGWDNLKLRFARTLRMNYQGLGDSAAVNKAIIVELNATRSHLYKTWRSNESYYRNKYQGIRRLQQFLAWSGFVALDFVWGNGESAVKLARTTIVLLALLAVLDTLSYRNPMLVADFAQALVDSPQVFLGTTQPGYPGLVIAGLTLIRYVVLGLFLSILIRRFARR
jgi:hypothetical protein